MRHSGGVLCEKLSSELDIAKSLILEGIGKETLLDKTFKLFANSILGEGLFKDVVDITLQSGLWFPTFHFQAYVVMSFFGNIHHSAKH